MFKSLWSGLKGLGKKAIGYVRGLNGTKAAKLLAGSLQKEGGAFQHAIPFLEGLGSFINRKLDQYSEFNRPAGGVRKPREAYNEPRSRRRAPSPEVRRQEPEEE